MNIFRDIFKFFIDHYDFIAILLLSGAVISLSIKSARQQDEIDQIKQQLHTYEVQDLLSRKK
ncbi:hypothetical protein K5E_12370 [Enterococcus thailandicus]|uniref:Uncharacterized protein n=2 Tax=root TaxID=1 RepID=A0A510WF18_ENTTH|nr:hypothetical protein A5800_001078 [Enterococcus sp. 5B7_DIV0075]GEK37706.1 hypothetical protein ETH01_19930 [Enterococcus thailandicus]GMC01526.1 hypothetical protein K2F_17860 [Enterococcus thailandicus]GMC02766.1 hypothetical protein K4E_02780 [Enterococcus thailandicus]GMC09098.1 hypothetical protein K5E_12370 [Enterococcus thailandicus]